MGQLSEEQNERFRAAARTWIAADGSRSKAALAKALEVSEASIGKILNKGGGASTETAERFAAVLGITREELLGPRGETRKPKLQTVELIERYPSRGRVLADPSYRGKWSETARQAVQAMAFSFEEDPGEAYWIRALDTFEVTVAGLTSALPKVSNALVDVDATEPGGRFRR